MKPENPHSTPAESELPTHNEEGVDLVQIRKALAMTPDERLQALTDMMASLERLRGSDA